MLNYSCIIKEDHLDIRKLSENVNIPLSKACDCFIQTRNRAFLA